ncbi:3-keto-disaccharide hydrolase [Terriglobus roseus]|uniref:3-keto-alpha-glucoside-1,2-lyase/3-keto-2-hydroxy-glucal hydratase domain-containing protein n=1 Tax=Terriglobus roseus TaxID=392734 RepID=A0A1G7KP60_9BACT|nr:DUF1080 domain-containing protein [Terriglobus roseus]SDF39048.1 protein of unknown function [Terriglobus roseus]
MMFRRALWAMLMLATSTVMMAQAANTLTDAEKKDGWTLLFDGKQLSQWRGAYMDALPSHGWAIHDGELRGEFSAGMEAGDGGDIVTRKTYSNFEMVFDWKLGAGGNSGVKYFVEERQPKPQGSQPGYEYQIIDDAHYIYMGKPLDPTKKTAAIYDVVAPNKGDTSVGMWHTSRIRVRGNHIEHWLDGKKVIDVERTSAAFQEGVAKSKFHAYPNFAAIHSGHILLQDHGHNVAFRNLKLKQLP